MPPLFAHPTAAQLIISVSAAALMGLVGFFGYRAWKRRRITPEERERRRCAELVARGKITDAMLGEIGELLVFYSYSVRGMEYTASQDVSRFAGDPSIDFSAVSALSVKYDPRNPANSIVVAEDWSGLRRASRLLPERHAH